MNIKPLTTKEYATLDAYATTSAAKDLLQVEDALVVVEDGRPIGVMTLSDLALKTNPLVRDCLCERPVVNCTDSIDQVLQVMKTTGNSILPVNFENRFYGIIKQTSILFHLHKSHEKEKLALLAAAHDLRNPIASIRMLGTILKADPDLNKHRYLVNKLSETCDYAETLIRDILNMEQSQHEPIVFGDENLDELVNTCVDMLSESFRAKELVLSKQLLSNQLIKADRAKLSRAIHNILWNSIKFTHARGSVSVTTQRASGGQVLLIIRDTGIGISKSMQEKIFDKFTKAKRPGTAGEPTTGIGLYLTKIIIESHGGSIHMESDGQTGSCFTVALPVDTQE